MSAKKRFTVRGLLPAALAAGIFSAIYFLIASWLMRRWFAPSRVAVVRPAEPVTFFRPLKPGEPGLEPALEAFLAALQPDDQVLFGAADPDARKTVLALAERFRGLDIRCPEITAKHRGNPKIAKLEQLEPFARHDRWIVLDSDALPDAAFLSSFRFEWAASGADAFSAPYVFSETDSLSSALDAAGTELALWPGAALLRAAGRIDFLTGACMGVNGPLLKGIGGWSILRGALADDHELGLAVSRAGGRVGISRCVVTLAPPARGIRSWLLHQHRAFATFHLCNPAGSLGLPLTFGVAWSFFALLVSPLSLVRVIFHLAIFGCRCAAARALPGRRRPIGVVWLSAIAEPFFWAVSILPLPVWWAGSWIVPRKPPPPGKPSCQRPG